MSYWKDCIGSEIVECCYESLVQEPKTAIRDLIAACGLTWEEACLRFPENSLPVTTASYSQVRRQVYSESIARWERYKKHLGDLKF